jgi:hypothetical protein
MPHFKCVACKSRLYSAAAPTDLVGDLCPGCGSVLQPVGALTELVGFKSITGAPGIGLDVLAQEVALRIPRDDA